jgi:hypothetical protein
MNWYKTAQNEQENIFDDLQVSQTIKIDDPQQQEIKLDLYRGFDVDLNSLKRNGDGYILSPHQSEQQAIWFSQYLQDAQGRGEWILEYPLNAIKHYQRYHQEDGSYYDSIPQEIDEATDQTENSKYFGGIELPEGWLWSYKTQKYIIATEPITITRNMLHKDTEWVE